MEALILLAAVFFGGYLLGARRLKKKEHAGTSSIDVQLSSSIREIDPTKPRFDGLAEPDFHIVYKDESGRKTERDIWVYDVSTQDGHDLFECWCFLREEKRHFRSDRIQSIKNLQTGRKIKDLRKYIHRA